jgi:hypothetical protein
MVECKWLVNEQCVMLQNAPMQCRAVTGRNKLKKNHPIKKAEWEAACGFFKERDE